jgi:phenylpropionate dioxygenase-like ring-hydroxylating dioxygenase large terminal subunit
MLSTERNLFMTRVGRGQPMGELLRHFWLPLTLSEQLPERDGDPVRLRLLGEDLVVFRDTNGQIGAIGAFCPHRRAPLFFGRNEDCGLRCVYHGWKFDTTGACVDMPSEPAESDFKDKVRINAYPVREFGDTVWIYMGPGTPPELPQMEWATVPASHRRVAMWIVECNWLQVLEGNVDTAHVSFLHSAIDGIPGVREEGVEDRAPQLQVIENEVGFAYGGRRKRRLDNQYYWRVTQFLLPMYTLIPGPGWPRACVGVVPIDNDHAIRFQVSYNPEAPIDREPPFTAREMGEFHLPDGKTIDFWLPTENRANRYGLDRQRQRKVNYSGIQGIETQDRAMTEGMGTLCDRAEEHLGTSDLAVIAMRRVLERRAQDLEKGVRPRAAQLANQFGARPLDVVGPEANMGDLLARHATEVRMIAVTP